MRATSRSTARKLGIPILIVVALLAALGVRMVSDRLASPKPSTAAPLDDSKVALATSPPPIPPDNLQQIREVDLQIGILSRSPSSADREHAAQLALGIGDLWRAEDLARTALVAAPQDRRIRLTLSESVSQQERFAEARRLYLQLMKDDPQDLQPYLQLQSIAVREGNAKEGWQWLSKAMDQSAQTPSNMIALAHRYYSLNDVPGAQRVLGRAAQIAPDDVNVKLQRAILFYQRAQLDECRAVLDPVIQAHPNAEPAVRLLASVYVHPAYHEQNDMRANELLEKAIELDRKDPEIYRLAAIVYRRLHLNRMAAEAYNAFLILEPRNADARYGLGQTYALVGRKDLAQTQFDLSKQLRASEQQFSVLSSAVSQKPLSARAHGALGAGLQANGDYAGALREMQIAVGLAPSDSALKSNLNQLYRLFGWGEPARKGH